MGLAFGFALPHYLTLSGGARYLLDQIATPAVAAYSQARRLRDGYTGALTRVRRSADNLERDIPFATNTQTRTNLAVVQPNNDGGTTVAGVTMTTIGTGTEFGLPYIEVRWQGTATVAGFLQFASSSGAFNPATQPPVTPGLTYTTSFGYRLVAGAVPVGAWGARAIYRLSNGNFSGTSAQYVPATPSAAMVRISAVGAATAGAAYAQANIFVAVALSEVVDYTLRVYAINVELGIGNARPMLTRNVPEVIAAPNDLDAEALLLHCNGINQLTWSEQFDNAVWPITNATVTANTTLAPNGTLTADTLTENAAAGQHRFARTTASLTAGQEWTESIYVKRGVGSRQLQLGLSGGGLVAKAYFDLGTGTVGFTDQCTATITPDLDGYYRVSLTATIITTVAHSLFLAMANGTTNGSETYTGDGVSSLIIWGNQFNPGAILPYVIAEGTALTGLGSGFEAVTYDQGYFAHAVRRNLLSFTEQFDNAVWSRSGGVTNTSNNAVAPNGTMTADTMSGTSIAPQLIESQSVTRTINPGDTYTISVWVRNATSNLSFRIARSGAGAYEDAAIPVPVSSSWQRIQVSRTFANAQTGVRFDFVTNATANVSLERWGAQLELSATASDYQPILSDTGQNLVQATAANQFRLVSNGAFDQVNGKPQAIVPTTGFAENNFGAFPQPFTRSYVVTRLNNTAVGGFGHVLGNFQSSPNTTEYLDTASNINMYAGGTPVADTSTPFALNETAVFTSIYDNTVGSTLTKNGVTRTAPANGPGTTTLNGARVGTQNATLGGVNGFSEFIIFTSALPAAERQTLQRNQGAYFGVSVA